jgi:hypothetical protein
MAVPRDKCARRLIVEGKDDMFSIISLMMRHGWIWDDAYDHIPFVKDAGGVNEAIESLPTAIKSLSRIGIVVDADMNCSSRWDQIKAKAIGYFPQFPENPDHAGTILTSGEKRLGIWLMPNNVDGGKLEDFLSTLVPEADQCWSWAEEATKQAKSRGAQFTEADFIKAHIHTWLAWGPEPGLPFGTAITAASFSHDSAIAIAFVKWMKALFAE